MDADTLRAESQKENRIIDFFFFFLVASLMGEKLQESALRGVFLLPLSLV